MPLKGIERVRTNYAMRVKQIAGPVTEDAIRDVLEAGANIADAHTPVDTGTLLASRYQPVVASVNGRSIGHIGYTAAYAAAVHSMPGKLRGQPRADFATTRDGAAFGGGTGVGNYWDPDAHPQWLERAFEDIRPYVPGILKAAYQRG